MLQMEGYFERSKLLCLVYDIDKAIILFAR